MGDLTREYERARFPAHRQLDLHGEGPRAAREIALHWIQSRAHETPGEELLLIVERGRRPGRRPAPVAVAVAKLLTELEGKLIAWWQDFTPGTLACRIADRPSVLPRIAPPPGPNGDGRTEETSGAARPPPQTDIPEELFEIATRAAELRIDREGLSIRILDVVLREVWLEAQSVAMEERLSFAEAVERILRLEVARVSEE
ncbi:MAG: hypothetical protein GEU90_16045 [Gemmatimonas sp.]|nr:hypothetical protein [Gemmatimonas sp.]